MISFYHPSTSTFVVSSDFYLQGTSTWLDRQCVSMCILWSVEINDGDIFVNWSNYLCFVVSSLSSMSLLLSDTHFSDVVVVFMLYWRPSVTGQVVSAYGPLKVLFMSFGEMRIGMPIWCPSIIVSMRWCVRHGMLIDVIRSQWSLIVGRTKCHSTIIYIPITILRGESIWRMYDGDYINRLKSRYGEKSCCYLCVPFFMPSFLPLSLLSLNNNTFGINGARQTSSNTTINRYYSYIIAKNGFTFKPLSFLFHTVPGHLLDVLAFITGKPRMYVTHILITIPKSSHPL